jgi:hypothetical protein
VRTESRPRRPGSWGLYRLQLGLGAAGLGASALVLAAGVSSVHVRPDAARRLDVAGIRLTYPAVNAAAVVLLALAALGAAVLIVTARAAWRQFRAHRRLIRGLPVAGPLAEHPAVLVVDAAAPLAFCAGWLRPRVYVSTGVLGRLSKDEKLADDVQAAPRRARSAPPGSQPRALPSALLPPVLRPLHDRYADVAGSMPTPPRSMRGARSRRWPRPCSRSAPRAPATSLAFERVDSSSVGRRRGDCPGCC